MSKSLEELQREYEKNTVKLEQEKRKLRRLENRKSYLDSGSRKQRSHRLITRGAAIESVMPEVKILTEQEFYSLMERIAEWQPVQNMVRLAVENHSQPHRAPLPPQLTGPGSVFTVITTASTVTTPARAA